MRKKVTALLLILCLALSVMAGCANKKTTTVLDIEAKAFTPAAEYTEGTPFTLKVSDYFKNNDGAVYTANIGVIENGMYTLLLTAGEKKIEITATKNNKSAKLEFSLNVVEKTPEVPDNKYSEWAQENKKIAVDYAKVIFNTYWRADNSGSRIIPGGSNYPYLWPYTEQVAMCNAVLEILDETKDAADYAIIKDYLEKSIEGLRYYRLENLGNLPFTTVDYGKRAASGKSYAIYNSGRTTTMDSQSNSKGGVFFDDNIWVAREFLNAYNLLGKIEYLNECLSIMDWIIGEGMETGISVADPGASVAPLAMNGVYWLWGIKDTIVNDSNDDGKTASLNSCSTAPTAMVALKLYNQLKTDETYKELVTGYRDKAAQMLNFMNRVLRSTESTTTGMYCDKVFLRKNNEGKIYLGMIDQQKLPYNTGCMIMAEAEFVKIPAGEGVAAPMQAAFKKYMIESAARADTSYAAAKSDGLYSFPSNSWFSSFLTDAYADFYQYDTVAEDYLYKMKITLDYAYKTHIDASGLIPPTWYDGWDHPDYAGKNDDHESNPKQILLQSANARSYAVLSKFYAKLAIA